MEKLNEIFNTAKPIQNSCLSKTTDWSSIDISQLDKFKLITTTPSFKIQLGK